ncbi:MAG: hypothetical protein QXP38_13230, partial [Nitrososphaerota archaeon]
LKYTNFFYYQSFNYVAILLGTSEDLQHEIFEKAREAYNIRSRALHGEKTESLNIDDLKGVNDISRRTILAILRLVRDTIRSKLY